MNSQLRAVVAWVSGRPERRAIARRLSYLFLLIVQTSFAWSQVASSSQSREIDQFTLRVSVSSVVLHPTVQNRQGVAVSGLEKKDFQVYEDGTLQQITYFSHEDVPVTVGLIVDNSGSIRPKRPDIITAALAFARSSNPQDQMFVINFNEHVSFGLPKGTEFTDSPAQLEAALSRTRASGLTALYDAIADALEQLKKGNREKKVLIVITDGGDNASKHTLPQISTMTAQSDAIIYTMGIFDEEDADQNPKVLKHLAKTTGGASFLNVQLSDVIPLCERIARDIRNQYTIAYEPTNGRHVGGYRGIEIKAVAPGHGRLLVRARAGYYASSDAATSVVGQAGQP